MAEVVKTGLLMGQPVWELPIAELVRRCASFKAAVCLADPHDRGPRNQLNLGHTFGHALEAAAGYDLPHGQAVALGMVAALRLSGNDEALDRGAAASSTRSRCASTAMPPGPRSPATRRPPAARPASSCSSGPASPRWGDEVPAADVRAALDGLIAD